MINGGKLSEELKIQSLFLPASRTGTSALYNGQTDTSGGAIDTQGFDELMIVIHAGTFSAGASVAFKLVHSETDVIGDMADVTDGGMTTITTANDNAVQVGMVKCKNYYRYIYLCATQANATPSLFSATAILGKADSLPQSNSPSIDI